MTTLFFTKQFATGILSGCVSHSKINFPSVDQAQKWVAGCERNEKRNGWKLIDKSFQSYTR